jgi:thiamine-monophosphate kinase
VTISDLTETELIGRIRSRLPPQPDWMVVGIGDDAAVVEPERNRLEVLSVDALVEGVHFDRAFTPPEAIGHRALAVNLSDLAAMGAAPRLALLSIALPPALAVEDFDRIIGGLLALGGRHGLHIAGGNLTRSPGPLVLDVMVAGTVTRRRPMARGGARPGDDLYVSGAVGSAAAGLDLLRNSPASAADFPGCVRRFQFPEPRVRLGCLLGRNRAASASVDLSDGLCDGVRQIALASGVGATIDADRVPIDPDDRAWFLAQGADPVDAAITGGDDYELLVAIRPRASGRLAAAARHGDVPLTRIGVCTEDPGLRLRRTTGSSVTETPLPAAGYRHFR